MSLMIIILKNIFFLGMGIFISWKSIKYFFEAAELDSFTTLLCSIILFLVALNMLYQAPIVKNYVDKPSNTCASQREAKQNDTNKP